MKVKSILFFCLFPFVAFAQDYGVQWVIGDRESVLDFRNDTLTNYPIGPIMPMFLTSANICDSSGNLLFYTNGVYIAGNDGTQITNGDSLSPCDATNQQECCGLDIPQGALFLPMPGDQRYYYLFHMSEDTVNDGRPGKLYYSIIDVETNTVISKNNIFFRGAILREGGMTACKHANGRDYWIIIGGNNTNKYYKFLLTPIGITAAFIQSIGPIFNRTYDLSYSKLSQDGREYATGCIIGPSLIMDFDRCTGEFSNPRTVTNQENDVVSLEFSPNGRFLYVTNSINLAQFDLLSPNPQQDSVWLHQSDSSDVIKMRFLQLAPNGKLYSCTWNGGFYFIHAVAYPDVKGVNSEYIDTAFIASTANTLNFPNMVNYQLGALIGSGCDTITTLSPNISKEERTLRVMPNPADKYLYVEMGMQGNYELDLMNDVGQIIAKRETRQVDIFDTEKLASGVYFLRASDKSNGNNSITQKVVVQH